jgi:hypothetical protein
MVLMAYRSLFKLVRMFFMFQFLHHQLESNQKIQALHVELLKHGLESEAMID